MHLHPLHPLCEQQFVISRWVQQPAEPTLDQVPTSPLSDATLPFSLLWMKEEDTLGIHLSNQLSNQPWKFLKLSF